MGDCGTIRAGLVLATHFLQVTIVTNGDDQLAPVGTQGGHEILDDRWFVEHSAVFIKAGQDLLLDVVLDARQILKHALERRTRSFVRDEFGATRRIHCGTGS
ncbi:hypothetical protein XsacCFBP4641_19170 [Xanthomonas sacchari]|uniref:Uncharacterized protein n=1 Tax=Xanthomonas sacchari TaxID=56458 RepID=A0A2P5YZ66_9XANT|nr:hypothetical protein XsacCFBP4641_19170 [Xanthomonas sacchari]